MKRYIYFISYKLIDKDYLKYGDRYNKDISEIMELHYLLSDNQKLIKLKHKLLSKDNQYIDIILLNLSFLHEIKEEL